MTRTSAASQVVGLFDSDTSRICGHHEVVTEPAGQYFRFMKPILVQQKCLFCHGSRDQMPEPIRMLLKKHYPFDVATGYKAGELRGTVSIKQPLGGQDR